MPWQSSTWWPSVSARTRGLQWVCEETEKSVSFHRGRLVSNVSSLARTPLELVKNCSMNCTPNGQWG